MGRLSKKYIGVPIRGNRTVIFANRVIVTCVVANSTVVFESLPEAEALRGCTVVDAVVPLFWRLAVTYCHDWSR